MSANKKVWIVTYNYGSVKAGPVIRFSRYLPHFKNEGLDPVFVTIDRKEKCDPNDTTIYLPYQEYDQFSMSVCKQALIDKPDAVIFLSAFYKMTGLINKIKKEGIPCIYVNTMKLSLDFRENGEKRGVLNKWVLTFLSKRLYNSFSTIVNSTKTLEQEFINLGIPQKNLKIIYNGVDTKKFAPVDSNEKGIIKTQLGLPDTFCFLFVGLLVQRKGVLELVEAWMAYKETTQTNAVLVLVGDEMENIPENSADWLSRWQPLMSMIKDPNNKYDIIYTPFVKNVGQYYKAVDSFIFLSFLEGMPNVLLESMSTGLPVVSTKFVGYSNDYGREGEDIIITENREADYLAKLFGQIEENKVYQDVGSNARKHAQSHFSIEKSIKSYIDITQ